MYVLDNSKKLQPYLKNPVNHWRACSGQLFFYDLLGKVYIYIFDT